MIRALMLSLILVLPTTLSARQSQAEQSKDGVNWDSLRFLVGEWLGEGSGAPGEATGGFSFNFDLQGKILVRKSRADYQATKDKPAYSHTDLMVIYQEPEGKAARAIYFDNEGHVIHYGISLSKDQKSLILVSDVSPSSPRFRFIYGKSTNDRLTFEFDIAPPGKPESFSKYIEGTARRKSAAN